MTGGVGATYFGGLVGQNDGLTTQTCAAGTVTGDSGVDSIGGLIGVNKGSAPTSYWDTVATGKSNGYGLNSGAFSATVLTTTQLQSGTLCPGFDPKVWGAAAGSYPFLKGLPQS